MVGATGGKRRNWAAAAPGPCFLALLMRTLLCIAALCWTSPLLISTLQHTCSTDVRRVADAFCYVIACIFSCGLCNYTCLVYSCSVVPSLGWTSLNLNLNPTHNGSSRKTREGTTYKNINSAGADCQYPGRHLLARSCRNGARASVEM